MEHFFNNVYETNIWGNNHNTEYSGSSDNGSRVDYNTKEYLAQKYSFIHLDFFNNK
jgi:hypothetical protein